MSVPYLNVQYISFFCSCIQSESISPFLQNRTKMVGDTLLLKRSSPPKEFFEQRSPSDRPSKQNLIGSHNFHFELWLFCIFASKYNDMTKKLVRFDWAMKKMLRHKANFDILEGFLSELLNDDVTIKQVLESESNKEMEDDKFDRVDILVENEKGELVIIEVQNTQEYDYFQ